MFLVLISSADLCGSPDLQQRVLASVKYGASQDAGDSKNLYGVLKTKTGNSPKAKTAPCNCIDLRGFWFNLFRFKLGFLTLITQI